MSPQVHHCALCPHLSLSSYLLSSLYLSPYRSLSPYLSPYLHSEKLRGVQIDIHSPYLEPRPPPGGPPLLKSLLGRPMYLPGVGVWGRLVMEKSTLTCTMQNAMSHNYCACAQVSPAARQAPGRPSPSWPPPPARPSRSRRKRSPCRVNVSQLLRTRTSLTCCGGSGRPAPLGTSQCDRILRNVSQAPSPSCRD